MTHVVFLSFATRLKLFVPLLWTFLWFSVVTSCTLKKKERTARCPKAIRRDEEAQRIMLSVRNQKHMWGFLRSGAIFPQFCGNTGFSSWDRMTCVSVDQQPSPCMSTYNDSDFYADSCWICFIFLNFWKENTFTVMQHTPTNFPCMSQNVTGTLWCIIISSPVTNHCLPVWSKCSIKWSVTTDVTEPNDANIKSL